MNTPELYERIFFDILDSSVFRTDGPGIDLVEELTALARAVHAAPDDVNWCLGEGGEACLSDLIVGAYWALTEWHNGQWSPEYAALCALGRVYTPNMESTPSPDDPARTAYELVCAWFQEREGARATSTISFS